MVLMPVFSPLVASGGGSAPTLDPSGVMAWDPAGSTSNQYGIGSHPDISENYNLWPVNGNTDTVDQSWSGVFELDTARANALVIDPADLIASTVGNAGQGRSYSFWIRLEETDASFVQEIFGQGKDWVSESASLHQDHGVRINGDLLQHGWNGATVYQHSMATSKQDFQDAQWHHICLTYENDDKDFCFDGVHTGGNGQSGPEWDLPGAPYPLVWALGDALGGQADHTGDFASDRPFKMEVGDIRIYNRKITNAEALALFNDGRYEYAGQAATVGSGGYSYTNTEAQTYVNAMTVAPDDTFKGDIDQLISDLKSGQVHSTNTWTLLDDFGLLCMDTEQAALLHVKNPTNSCTAVNSPTFNAGDGYTMPGSTEYIDTNWEPANDGVNYTQNSAFMFYWQYASASGQNRMGVGNEVQMGAGNYRINGGSTGGGTGAGAGSNALGLQAVMRTSSSAHERIVGTTTTNSASTTSTALTSASIYIGGTHRTSDGSLEFPSNTPTAAWGFASSLTSNELTDLHDAFNRFMLARSVGGAV